MPDIHWKSPSEFSLQDVNFRFVLTDFDKFNTSAQEIILLKDKPALDLYQSVLEQDPPARVLEFGTYQGGSPVYLSLMFNLRKYVGIDICNPVQGLQDFLVGHPVGRNINIHYQTSQDDSQAIRSIIDQEFGNDPIDLIVDDASHQYELSRRTFEITYPLLRPGGLYVIEDWGWAHWQGFNEWQDAPALSNLVFQLSALCAAHMEIIQEIRIFPVFMFIKKPETPFPNTELSLDNLVGDRAKNLNLI